MRRFAYWNEGISGLVLLLACELHRTFMCLTLGTLKLFFTMKSGTFTILFLAVFLFILAGCRSNPPKKNSTNSEAMSESTKSKNPYYSRTDTTVLHVSNEEWKKVLPDSIYEVARNKDTEQAFTGKYYNFDGLGTYYCAACGNKLFRSDAKFASTCGWPSFFETSRKNSVAYVEDHSYGMDRTEVLCGRCGAHLGHLFDDGPPPTGKRYCMNSVVLDFEPDAPPTSGK
jgi:peptide-methionine (R)-S-oxide reductase